MKLESTRSRFWWSLVSGEDSPPGLLMPCFLLCSLMTSPLLSGMERERQISFWVQSHCGLRLQHVNFGGTPCHNRTRPGSGNSRCCSVAKLCLTLCDLLDCSMPGSSVLYYLLKFAQGRKLKEVVEPDSMPGLLPPEPEFLLITHFSLTGQISSHYFYFLKKKKKLFLALYSFRWTSQISLSHSAVVKTDVFTPLSRPIQECAMCCLSGKSRACLHTGLAHISCQGVFWGDFMFSLVLLKHWCAYHHLGILKSRLWVSRPGAEPRILLF